MAGLIREEDIAAVRDKARIEEVIEQYVHLKPAGGGALKGLCPFHDEKSPSFHVRPGKGYHCFGCGEGGDVISFLMKHDGLSFGDAVQHLADKYGVELRRQESGERQQSSGVNRQRLLAANRAAQKHFADLLQTPEALAARQFLTERGFDKQVAEDYGLGFAPRGGEDLFKHLRGQGFTDAELVTAGLCAQGQRGHYDRFRGRLVWPIRDTSGETIGFGARRIFDDDRIEAKYLNTPETPLYKKSQVLYGVDLARREISKTSQAVVVEGYTDVMACHLAGVKTAVASCGTAFGEEHSRVLRRLLNDHEEFRGEVIFTFDGDEAGQKAALKAFAGDQQFVAQTYVAVEPSGLDPCDLRLQQGDAAVRELVARRIPLYRFVLGNVVSRFDLDRADGRIDALREAAKLVVSIRDRSKVEAFTRELAGMIGVEIDEARTEVRRASSRGQRAPQVMVAEDAPAPRSWPNPRDPRFSLERDVLKLTLQYQAVILPHLHELGTNDFTHPAYAAIWAIIAEHGAPADGEAWVDVVRAQAADPELAAVVNALAVEPLPTDREPDRAYANAHVFKLMEVTAMRAIADLKSKIQRTNPVEQATEYNRMFGDLVALEQHRRALRERGLGGAE
ncbi:MAG: DNA primase [Nocardioidaceae bacterium]